jgi:hypothetical protein
LAEEGSKPTSLVVQLRREVFALPWFRFFYAQGDNSSVQIVFASHTVTVTGHGLAALLSSIATERLSRLVQPSDNEARFAVRGPGAAQYAGPSITAINVEKSE